MKRSSFVFILILFLYSDSFADRFYVSATALAGGDGASWETAFNFLQDALDKTKIDRDDEIWVTAGTYYPDDGASVIEGDRTATFRLKRTSTLYGGFDGTETSVDDRDLDSTITVLSGAISEDQALWSLHVCKVPNANLDGLTITNGNANGEISPDNEGGAVDASGTIIARNCHFIGNLAKIGGVAVGGTWTVSDSIFSDNQADTGGVASGGTWTVSDIYVLGQSGGLRRSILRRHLDRDRLFVFE
ncbi:MAG: hypothetical protein O3C43_19315 [Verrucomicrobia bacterium]|nr:hypothetical protein [Verrucomicrobiota bacterium]MDA1068640.1 hypothetical protein [Verrucomicrobiota bacterium]